METKTNFGVSTIQTMGNGFTKKVRIFATGIKSGAMDSKIGIVPEKMESLT